MSPGDQQRTLLQGYLDRRRKLIAAQASAWNELLDGYRRIVDGREKTRRHLAEVLLHGYAKAVGQLRDSQRTAADDFNLLTLLDFVADELRHSRILAWLLDLRETHAQGNLGFLLFLEEVELPSSYASAVYHVRREVSGENSRIDVEICAPGKFLIHIENKIYAVEGNHQLERESEDLRRRAEELHVPEPHTHGFFLTRTGELPERHGRFRPLPWSRIGRVFTRFSEDAEAPSVQWFTKHYAEALASVLVPEGFEEAQE